MNHHIKLLNVHSVGEKKPQQNQMLGGKVRLITKLWEFMKQKIEMNTKCVINYKKCFCRKKDIIAQTKLKRIWDERCL